MRSKDSIREGKSSVSRFVDELDTTVFVAGFVLSLTAIVTFLTYPQLSVGAVLAVTDHIRYNYTWVYVVTMFLMLLFVLFLLFGKWRDITLGKPAEDPEFTLFEFFAMMFSAGIAAGIVFWGPAEAIFHYDTVPPLIDAESQMPAAATGAVQYTLFHWGIYYLIPYTIIGIPIAFLSYRHDAPLRISTLLVPFVGIDGLDNVWGKLLDIFAVLVTIGGITTTLGFIGSQLLSGVQYTTGITFGNTETILLISGLTVVFTLSAVLGIERGIRRLSLFNVILFSILGVLTFLVGPTNFIINLGVQATGGYLDDFFEMSLYTGMGEGNGWIGSWTVFYWAWVFSWAPFGGLFVARISRGRTVREVAAATIFGATAGTLPWFYTMGGTAIWLQRSGRANLLEEISAHGIAISGFPIFNALPLGPLLGGLFPVLITTFFLTSADSSTLALGMLTTGGKESPSSLNRIIWGTLTGILASLLIVGGGVPALRSLAILSGLPFVAIAMLAIVATSIEFRKVAPIFERSATDKESSRLEPYEESPKSHEESQRKD
ncbi:BCCT family transporter [Haloterrigena salifodinae]|uniref:BCCT family transporter n=1 Tax=Haloterrigena salifodinae TaxID=2675099 RepID=A0A8T8E870_9EURY|nr:BCCT family transporter [Haloterrigena salifodinae]QRV17823.1 BCCT family transporter [Haloterrigena salifodinae]